MVERTIKFSHAYNKMPFEDWVPNIPLSAKLLEVLISDKKELSKEFIEYDTAFCECISKEEQKYHKGFYPLPAGKLLILLLLTINSSGSHLWTTVRRHTPEKENYYRKLRGEMLTILIDDEVSDSVGTQVFHLNYGIGVFQKFTSESRKKCIVKFEDTYPVIVLVKDLMQVEG